MKKIIYIIMTAVILTVVISCSNTNRCSAYGENWRYQRPSNVWIKK